MIYRISVPAVADVEEIRVLTVSRSGELAIISDQRNFGTCSP